MKTTNFYLIIALFVLMGNVLNAQTSIFIAPEIGIQNSKFNTTGDFDISGTFQTASVDYSGIFSYQGGFGVGIQFADEKWGLMTGLKFNRKGGKYTVESRDPNNPLGSVNGVNVLGEFTGTTTANFLSIPILARAQFGNTLKFGLAIGPQINMGIGEYSSTVEYNLENASLPNEEEKGSFGESTSDDFKKTHMSLLILPYVSYTLNPNSSIRFSVMFENGGDMANENLVVNNGDGTSRNVKGTVKNNQFGVMLSYEYRFDLNLGTKY